MTETCQRCEDLPDGVLCPFHKREAGLPTFPYSVDSYERGKDPFEVEARDREDNT